MAGPSDDRVEFCTREFPRLVGALSLYCGDRGVAEELAQEALARVCRDWARVSAMAAPGPWTHRVAMNLASSQFRRRAAERRALRRLWGRRQEPHRDHDAADTAAVRAAVSTLPRRQRQAVVLRYYSDLPAREVAALMGCAEATVRTLTRDGLAGLRAHLSDDWEVLDVL